MYEFIVVLANGSVERVIAENITAALSKFELLTDEIVNVFRNGPVSDIEPRKIIKVTTNIFPPLARETGCVVAPQGVHEVKEGDSIILSAFSSQGWYFSEWQKNEVSTGVTDNTATFIADKDDATFTAVFKSI